MSEVTEAVLDTIEDQIDGVVEVVEVVRNNPKALVAVAVVGSLAGATAGYFIAKKKLQSYYEDLATQEISEAKEFYANLNKVDVDGRMLTPQDVMKKRHGEKAAVLALSEYQGLHDAIDDLERKIEVVPTGEPYDEVRDEEHILKMQAALKSARAKMPKDKIVSDLENETKTVNVFVDNTFDLQEEKKYRTEDKPYIITHDEFFEAEKDYETQSLTYFEVDDTLIDEQDKPIEDTDTVVGDDHFVRFGSGSQDKNIVYIRNDRMGVDYEITRSRGSYLEEVLGMPNEEPGTLKHSNRETQLNRRRAFRHGDG